MKYLGLILSITWWTLACSQQGTLGDSSTKNIFEADNRVPGSIEEYPLNAVGRVVTPDGKWCTGFLVSPNLVVTNAHCLTVTFDNLQFMRGYNDGEYLEASHIVTAYRGTTDSNNRVNDFAILVLERDMNPAGKWFDLDFEAKFPRIAPETEEDTRNADTEGRYVMASYPSDYEFGHKLMIETGCEVFGRNANWNYLYHDCDNKMGASGAPIYYLTHDGRAKVVAINAAERMENHHTGTKPEDGSPYRHHIANLATSLEQVKELYHKAKAKFPHSVDRSLTPKREIHICNETEMKIYAAFAYQSKEGSTDTKVNGWFQVAAGSCNLYSIRAVGEVHAFAFHWTNARPLPNEGWPLQRDQEYCINTRSGFHLNSDMSCALGQTDYMYQPFGLIPNSAEDGRIDWTIEKRK